MKKKIVFLYEAERAHNWRDGLWAALNLLEQDYDIVRINMYDKPNGIDPEIDMPLVTGADMFLAWGSFNAKTFEFIVRVKLINGSNIKTGLCVGGTSVPVYKEVAEYLKSIDVLFYETAFQEPELKDYHNKYHAFGINGDIYKPMSLSKIWDYIGIGTFSTWKRWEKMIDKQGMKLVIGGYQLGGTGVAESAEITNFLIRNNVMVSNELGPEQLAILLNSAKVCYIPSVEVGGGERAVLEARACGLPVEIEPDNFKLRVLLDSPIWDHHYYYAQLKKGIESVL